MTARLTEAEKAARGTAQKCRALQPRNVKEIRRDIRDAKAALRDMRRHMKLASQSIREEGMWIVDERNQRKPNPAFNIQQKALSASRTLKHTLALLEEELQLATAKESVNDDFADFD